MDQNYHQLSIKLFIKNVTLKHTNDVIEKIRITLYNRFINLGRNSGSIRANAGLLD